MSKLAVSLLLASLLAAAGCCTASDDLAKRTESESPRARKVTEDATDLPAGRIGFELVNNTGGTIRGVYLSPSDSTSWAENVLGDSELQDDNTVNIRFSPQERASLWDLKVEGDRQYAEWKSINLQGASSITLRLKLDGGTVVVAEVE